MSKSLQQVQLLLTRANKLKIKNNLQSFENASTAHILGYNTQK